MSQLPYLSDTLWITPPDEMFVRPDWSTITTLLKKENPADASVAWNAILHRWGESLCGVLNELLAASGTRRYPYRLDRSANFLFLTPYSLDIAREMPPLGEAFLNLARQTLGPRIVREMPAPCLVVIFHDVHVAQEYLRYFGINAGAILGVCIDVGPTHIVMHSNDHFSLRLVFLHELSHATLQGLKIPTWIHEGLSRHFETRLLAKAHMRYATEVHLGRNRYWHQNGLDDFWSGKLFYDGRAEVGYLLAQKMVSRLILQGAEKFAEFILQADVADAGNKACEGIYGHGLTKLLPEIIGTGQWAGPH